MAEKIYVTGDMHGAFERLEERFLRGRGIKIGTGDYCIVCGDVGLLWKKKRFLCEDIPMSDYAMERLSQKEFTILWVQGNHENYDLIKEYPLEEWHGGMVRHIVRDKVILLERGQVFELENQTFFTFGGAKSHDIQGGILDRKEPNFHEQYLKALESRKPFRIKGESWWEEELPTREEMKTGLMNLEKVGYKVDYVISHCCSTDTQNQLAQALGRVFEKDILTDYFNEVEKKLTYKHWFFGHYHEDRMLDERHTVLYHTVLPLKERYEALPETPIPGRPRYERGDSVEFRAWGRQTIGRITGIDAYGTSEQAEELSYDIFVSKGNVLQKHILESEIMRRIP